MSSVPAVVIEACDHFEDEIYKKLGLRPVFKLRQEFYDKTHTIREEMRGNVKVHVVEHNTDETLLEGCPLKEEIDNFIKLRETYCAEEILRRCSWADFVNRCEVLHLTEIIQRHRPCEDPSHQCSINCPRFNNCDQAQEVKYLYKETKENA